MSKRKGFADQVEKQAKRNLIPTDDQESVAPREEKNGTYRWTFP